MLFVEASGNISASGAAHDLCSLSLSLNDMFSKYVMNYCCHSFLPLRVSPGLNSSVPSANS